ncbi:MAG TPA: YfhO family protein, partial [Thermoanaerobaculia bacterium]|nr:YfhO family protein [Thermoanaerobaculia bacterium]
AAIFAAVAYGFSSFETVVLYYSVSAVSTLLPMVVFAVLHALDVPSRRAAVLVALSVAAIFANGHPESVVHVAMAVVVVLAIELPFARDRRDWLRRFVTPLVGAIAGVLIAMPVWLPAAQQVLLSTRYAVLRSGAPKMTIPLTAAWAMLNPNGFGNPARGNWNWILNYMIVAESYVGLLVLVLFAAAVVSPRTSGRMRLWSAAAIVTFIVAMDWTFLGHALNAIPPFDVAANDKLRFVSLFFAVVVAARWLDGAARERALPLVAFGSVAAGVSLYVYRKQLALLRPIDLAGVVAVVAFLILYSLLRSRARWLAGAAAALTLAELFAFNANFNRLVDSKYYRPELPIVQALRAHAPREPFRVAGFNWVLSPNGATQYGLEDIRGSDPMSLASYTRVLERVGEGTEVIRVLRPDHPLLDFLGVRFLLAEPEAEFGGKWRLLYRGRDGALFENSQARPRFFAEGAEVEVGQRSTAEFRLRVRASRPTTVVSSEPAEPGWQVRVGGRAARVRVVEEAFVGFDVPAGESRVTVKYRPATFYGALPAALAGLLLLLVSSPLKISKSRGIGL